LAMGCAGPGVGAVDKATVGLLQLESQPGGSSLSVRALTAGQCPPSAAQRPWSPATHLPIDLVLYVELHEGLEEELRPRSVIYGDHCCHNYPHLFSLKNSIPAQTRIVHTKEQLV
jgi:hypothetical protein